MRFETAGAWQNPSPETLLELCQGLYGTVARVEDADGDLRSVMYQDPYLSMANLLLELEDGPLPLRTKLAARGQKSLESSRNLRSNAGA